MYFLVGHRVSKLFYEYFLYRKKSQSKNPTAYIQSRTKNVPIIVMMIPCGYSLPLLADANISTVPHPTLYTIFFFLEKM